MKIKFEITPYQKSVLLALQHSGGEADEISMLAYLQSVGWSGLELTPERLEIALAELKDEGLVSNDAMANIGA